MIMWNIIMYEIRQNSEILEVIRVSVQNFHKPTFFIKENFWIQ